MKFTSKQYAQALFDAVQETNPKDYDLVMDNFVKVLAQNGDLNKHTEIEDTYGRLDREAKGISEAEVTFAKEHNEDMMKELNKVVQGKVEFKTKIDEGIIGGVVIRVDDTLLDASVQTQLKNLNQSLKS